MKKYLQMAMAAAVVATGMTACHNDDDGDGNYVASFESVAGLSTLPGMGYMANLGLYQYAMSDANGYTDAYIFTSAPYGNLNSEEATDDPNAGTTSVDVTQLAESYYGGFCPTTFAANSDEDNYTPACGEYHSGNGALICNPGLACKALFSRHIGADLSTLMGFMSVGKKVLGLWVAPTTEMAYVDPVRFEEAKQKFELDNVEPLPANTRIEFVVYGYVESFDLSNFKKAVKTIKDAGAGMASGGKLAAVVTLVSSDANGKVTVNSDWQYVDLSGTKAYLWEAALRVVDQNGKTVDSYSLTDEMTNYCLVDDITYESASLF